MTFLTKSGFYINFLFDDKSIQKRNSLLNLHEGTYMGGTYINTYLHNMYFHTIYINIYTYLEGIIFLDLDPQ